jgi:hypothetical protein
MHFHFFCSHTSPRGYQLPHPLPGSAMSGSSSILGTAPDRTCPAAFHMTAAISHLFLSYISVIGITHQRNRPLCTQRTNAREWTRRTETRTREGMAEKDFAIDSSDTALPRTHRAWRTSGVI